MNKIGLEAVLEMGGFNRGAGQYNSALGDMNAKTEHSAGIIGKLGGVMTGLAKVGAAAGLAVVGGFAALAKGLSSCIGPASNLRESLNKVTVVFGESAEDIKMWAEGATTALGMSNQQALEAAGTYGNLFRAIGLTEEASADMSMNLTKLAADLGSFNNIPVDVALEKLRAGLTGESEPLKALGINMNEATIAAKALELGLISSIKDAIDPATKAQAAYALIMEQSSLAQGDFERTSDGLANKQKILGAQFEDVKATIGAGLIPILEQLAGKFSDAMASPEFQSAIGNVRTWLETELPNILNKVYAFIVDNLIPTLRDVWNWFADAIPKALEFAARFWTGVLLPAIEGVERFIREKLIPFINNTLIPAFEDIQATIKEDVIPALDEMATKLDTDLDKTATNATKTWESLNKVLENFGMVLEPLKPLIEVISQLLGLQNEKTEKSAKLWSDIRDGIGQALDPFRKINEMLERLNSDLEKVNNFMGTFKDLIIGAMRAMQDLNAALPDWFKPGSPTPLELGVRGINSAMADLFKVGLPSLTMGMQSLAPAGASAGATSNTVNVNMGGVAINNGMDMAVFEARVRSTIADAMRGV